MRAAISTSRAAPPTPLRGGAGVGPRDPEAPIHFVVDRISGALQHSKGMTRDAAFAWRRSLLESREPHDPFVERLAVVSVERLALIGQNRLDKRALATQREWVDPAHAAQEIRGRRERLGWIARDLAHKAGLSASVVCRLEQGRGARPDTLQRLREVLSRVERARGLHVEVIDDD